MSTAIEINTVEETEVFEPRPSRPRLRMTHAILDKIQTALEHSRLIAETNPDEAAFVREEIVAPLEQAIVEIKANG